MTSLFRSLLVASGIFAAFAAVQPTARAQGFGGAFSSLFSDDEDEDKSPVDVSASIADIYLEKNIVTLLGDVVVAKKEHRITCNKMEVFLKKETEKTEEEKKAEAEKKAAEAAAAAKPTAKPAVEPAVKKDDEKEAKKDEKEDDEMNQTISKLVCTGDVAYRNRNPEKPENESIALAAKGDYDDESGIIVMTEGHSNPQSELPKEIYEDIVRVVGKETIKLYPIMKQGQNWIVGDKIEIFLHDGNHMRVINPKASSNKAFTTNSTRSGSDRR